VVGLRRSRTKAVFAGQSGLRHATEAAERHGGLPITEIKTEFLFTYRPWVRKVWRMSRICSIATGALTVGGPFIGIGKGVHGAPGS
jgi:hypothetical protein